MEEEPEISYIRREPPVQSHRPLSQKSQDISHVLANIFKEMYTNDIIGKYTMSNLVRTKAGRTDYHQKYIEELRQVHAEYERCVQEANMLEGHIIQARARAAATEKQACERMREEMQCDRDDVDTFTVKSAFPYSVDQDLLVRNGLIAPQDYAILQKPQVRAPAAVKVDLAKPTRASNMQHSREPRDGGHAAVARPKKIVQMEDIDYSLTFESSSDTPKEKKTTKEEPSQAKVRPKWKREPSAEDRVGAQAILQSMKDRQCYLRNPRFVLPNDQKGGMSLIQPWNTVKVEQEKKGANRKREKI